MSILNEKAPGSDWKRAAMRRVVGVFGALRITDNEIFVASVVLDEPVSEVRAWVQEYRRVIERTNDTSL